MMVACCTTRLLASTPSAVARLLVMAVELRAVATALVACEEEPTWVKEMVAVVAVVIGVVTLTDAPKAVERDDVSELVSVARVDELTARLAEPLGATTMANVTTYDDCNCRRPLEDVSTCTSQLESPPQTLVFTDER